MTSMLAKYISKRILGESLQNNFGKSDPYFEEVPATRLDGRPSTKTKRRKKALPPGISEHDAKVLTKVKRRAWRLDMSLFNCCGVRFGYSSVIGIVPGVGDVLDAFMAMMVYRTCQQIEGGLPANVKAQMLFNIIVDFGIGLVPFLGDIADALFRANTKNAVVLEEYLRKRGAANLKALGQTVPIVDPSDPSEYDRSSPAEPGSAAIPTNHGPVHDGIERETRQPVEGRPQGDHATAAHRNHRGWFGLGSGKKAQKDIESGS